MKILTTIFLLISFNTFAQTFLSKEDVTLNLPVSFDFENLKESQAIKTELIRFHTTPEKVYLLVPTKVNGTQYVHVLKLDFKKLRPLEESFEDSYFLTIKVQYVTKYRVEFTFDIEGPAEVNTDKYFAKIFKFDYR